MNHCFAYSCLLIQGPHSTQPTYTKCNVSGWAAYDDYDEELAHTKVL